MAESTRSRMSHIDKLRQKLAGAEAKNMAEQEIRSRVQRRIISMDDGETIKRIYKEIYAKFYYECYYRLAQTGQQPNERSRDRRYIKPHTVVNFTRSNCLIRVHRGSITIARVIYPIDDPEASIETQEAFLSEWPGPLDQRTEDVRQRVTEYLETLLQHATQKRLKYTNPTSDEHRKTILNFLAQLLHRNGTTDAPGITKLLLQPEQTEITRDESSGKTFDITNLQKYLLLGKRSEAIKYARSTRQYDHAQCLAFLGKYQPPNNKSYFEQTKELRDDPVTVVDDFISSLVSMNQNIIQVVYRSLLNRIIQGAPGSYKLVKRPNVENNAYEFAILSANDCDMDFDQSNQIFTLITAVKNIRLNPNIAKNHLISLGYTSLESNDYSDGISLVTYDTPKEEIIRTLTISNIDMMILNEIWEYCQNLAWKTCNHNSYQYMVNLIPYKLVFASKLLDYGDLETFLLYINSIKCALSRANELEKDPFYDWQTIETTVDYLDGICENLRRNLAMSSFLSELNPEPIAPQMYSNTTETCPPPSGYDAQYANVYTTSRNDISALDYTDTSRFNHSYPAGDVTNQFNYAPSDQNNPQSLIQNYPLTQQRIPEETTDFNPEPESPHDEYPRTADDPGNSGYANDYSEGASRRTSIDAPVQPLRQQNYSYPTEPEHATKTMTSSSPVQKTIEYHPQQPPMSDSFSVMSPINMAEAQPISGYSRPSASYNTSVVNETKSQPTGQVSDNNINSSSNNNNNSNQRSKSSNSQPAAEQKSSLLNNLLPFLPRSNSKQMILPKDTEKTIEYDEERGAWIDKSNPDAESAITNDAPPMMPSQSAPSYSFANKSTKARYPRQQFGP